MEDLDTLVNYETSFLTNSDHPIPDCYSGACSYSATTTAPFSLTTLFYKIVQIQRIDVYPGEINPPTHCLVNGQKFDFLFAEDEESKYKKCSFGVEIFTEKVEIEFFGEGSVQVKAVRFYGDRLEAAGVAEGDWRDSVKFE